MITATYRTVLWALLFIASCLAGGPALAAELKPIEGEFRYYENGELVEHQHGIRALPDTPQTATAVAIIDEVASEDSPVVSSGLAIAQWLFEIEPNPDTDEQAGDPVCVVTTFSGQVSTTTDGDVVDASASVGGGESAFTEGLADADEQIAFADSGVSLPPIWINPLSAEAIVMTPFNSTTVDADESDEISEEFHFIAMIGDELRVEAASAAIVAIVYPGNAQASAASEMSAQLQPEVSDCELSLTTLVQSGEGSVQVSPEQSSYQFGDVVEITAVPDQGWQFAGWDGDAEGTDNPLTLTISNNTEVIANFEPFTPPPLAVPVNAPLAVVILALLFMAVGLRVMARNSHR